MLLPCSLELSKVELRYVGIQDFPVPCFRSGTGDWKVNRTRRQECLRGLACVGFAKGNCKIKVRILSGVS